MDNILMFLAFEAYEAGDTNNAVIAAYIKTLQVSAQAFPVEVCIMDSSGERSSLS